MTTKGLFVVLEGNDGAGKTTQAKLLQQRMTKELGVEPLLTAEPSKEGPIGRFIRSDLLKAGSDTCDQAVQLTMFADMADHIRRIIRPAIEQGRHVICDRYNLSTYVYGVMAGLSLEWLRGIGGGFLRPDMILFLEVPVGISAERVSSRPGAKERFEDTETTAKVDAAYRTVSRTENGVFVIDASAEIEQVAENVWRTVSQVIKTGE